MWSSCELSLRHSFSYTRDVHVARFSNAVAQRLPLRCEYRLQLIKDGWPWCVLIDLIKFRADGQSRYLDELGKGLIDEDQGDEEGKNLLCEW